MHLVKSPYNESLPALSFIPLVSCRLLVPVRVFFVINPGSFFLPSKVLARLPLHCRPFSQGAPLFRPARSLADFARWLNHILGIVFYFGVCPGGGFCCFSVWVPVIGGFLRPGQPRCLTSSPRLSLSPANPPTEKHFGMFFLLRRFVLGLVQRL